MATWKKTLSFLLGVLLAVNACASDRENARCPSPGDEELASMKFHLEPGGNSVFLKKLLMEKPSLEALDRYLSQGGNPNSCVPPGVSLLTLKAMNGDVSQVALLIKNGANPNFPIDSIGGGALMWAINSNQYEVANYLLDKGADPLAKTDINETLLVTLSMQTKDAPRFNSERQVELARRLLDAGVDINSATAISPLVASVLQKNIPLISLFLEKGADPNLRARGGQKKTPLEYAQSRGFLEAIELLERYGARPSQEK